jgi:plasmid stabilization system protein ParE
MRRIRIRRFPYFIFFRVRAEQLIVLAVFHTRRQPMTWRERK